MSSWTDREKVAVKMKGSWSPEEDEKLKGAVARHGARNWTAIGEEVPGRSGKSCRLRWCNQLSPSVHRRPFSPEEDALIVAAHAKYGNKWATIARLLHGRTDNSVKNHWNSSLRRSRRKAAAAAAANNNAAPAVSYQSMDLTEEEEDDDRTSDDSVAVAAPPPPPPPTASGQAIAVACVPMTPSPPAQPPAAKRLCVAAPPADPPTSLSLSPPGGGVVETQAPVAGGGGGGEAGGVSSAAVASEIARILQDPWLMAMMRQMVAEEVQRHMGMVYSLVASSAAQTGGGAGGVGRNGPDGGRPSNGQN
uniref:Uncharacterized protein n=1 Tax=Leersia perrieri TaxID=77586 RepID=A0A0D9WFF6_9ORYZ